MREHLLQTSQALDREHLRELGGKGKGITIYWLPYLEPSGMLVNVYQQQSGWLKKKKKKLIVSANFHGPTMAYFKLHPRYVT